MKIRSLLLGSAAALVAVPVAQAADAVIVEPEPVEYVRVCDAYGAGFFFIPGTETCIDFGGYIRSYYSVSHYDVTNGAPAEVAGTAVTQIGTNQDFGAPGLTEVAFTDWASRARFQVDTRNETDWGTLRGFFRIDTDLRGAGGQATVIDRGQISLAGFRAGLGTNYWTSNHGFAGVNLAGIVSDPLLITVEDGFYQGTTTAATLFDYTWAQDGLAITFGVQDTSGINRTTNAGGLHDYYAGFNYSADWGGVAYTYAYDSDASIVNLTTAGTGGDAHKVSVDLDLSEFVPGGRLHGMYMTDGNDATTFVTVAALANAEDIWQVSFQMDLTDEFVLAAQYSNAEEANGNEAWNAGIGLNWFPAAAPGFSVYAAYAFGEVDAYTGNVNIPGTPAASLARRQFANAFAGDAIDYDAFTIRVRRDF